MFYSHTFLAKKSPLGTVWIAAHLERRIKKREIEVVDVPSYADYIMFPEVPMALRLSGHLLLGLVRIYSWKVNDLFKEYIRIQTDIRHTFASVQVNLPPGAVRAPFESVTLPDTFELDALELDDMIYQADGPDNHLTTNEQITLTDYIPVEGDPYVAFVISEDAGLDPFPQPVTTDLDTIPMEEDGLPSSGVGLDAVATPVHHEMGVGHSGSSNQATDPIPSFNEERFSLPEIEVMRDAVNNSELPDFPEWPDASNDTGGVVDSAAHPMNRRESLSPIMEDVSVSGVGSTPTRSNGRAQTAVSVDDLELANTGISLGQPLPDLQLQPSPPIRKAKAKRKRKQFFDEALVLTNAEIRNQLEETTRLISRRQKLPCSTLYLWRFRWTRQKDQIFDELLLSGMSNDLQKAFRKSYPVLTVDSNPWEASSGPPEAQTHVVMPEIDMEPDQPQIDVNVNRDLPDFTTPVVDITPEQPRFAEHDGENLTDLMPSPTRKEDFSPVNTSNLDSASHMENTFATENLPPFEFHAAADLFGSDLETPFSQSGERWRLNETTPEIPGLQESAVAEELSFLEASNESPDNGALNVESISARTRAVAQYFNGQSPTIQRIRDESGNLSLHAILEGKTRKQSARMFYETLVLKSYDLIDVCQEEAYGDILISLKPSLSTAKL